MGTLEKRGRKLKRYLRGSEIVIASKRNPWPDLPLREWKDTCETLHLWMHSWHVPLYMIARGLTISPIYYEDRVLEIVSDFNRHALEILISVLRSRRQEWKLGPGCSRAPAKNARRSTAVSWNSRLRTR